MPTRGRSSFADHPPAAPTYVYVVERADEVVYVGVSHEPQRRWFAHHLKSWWTDDMAIRPVVLTHRAHAFDIEARLIAALRPAHNRYCNPNWRKAVA